MLICGAISLEFATIIGGTCVSTRGSYGQRCDPAEGDARGAGGTCASAQGSASDAGGCYRRRCNHTEGDARVPGDLRERPGQCLRRRGVLWAKVRPCGGRCKGAGGLARAPGAVPWMQGGVTGEGATMRRVMRGVPGGHCAIAPGATSAVTLCET